MSKDILELLSKHNSKLAGVKLLHTAKAIEADPSIPTTSRVWFCKHVVNCLECGFIHKKNAKHLFQLIGMGHKVKWLEKQPGETPKEKTQEMKNPQPSLMRFFEYKHLPEHLQKVSMPFHALATIIDESDANDKREKAVAMRKLLEAKDAAVRASL